MTVQLAAVTFDEMEEDPAAVQTDETADYQDAEPCDATEPPWEAEALEQIKRARVRVAMMEGRYLEAKDRAKDCKTSWEAAVEELTEVIDAATKPLPLFDQKPATTEPTGDPTEGDGWREIPIDEIFLGVKGLGEKKREAISEAIPTLGAFEDLRKKASLAGDPLREHMPKGIGQEACDQLEEAVLNCMSRWYEDQAEDQAE